MKLLKLIAVLLDVLKAAVPVSIARFVVGIEGWGMALVALAPVASAQTFNAQEQAEIRAVVREYLVSNPDVLREALGVNTFLDHAQGKVVQAANVGSQRAPGRPLEAIG